MIPCERYAFFTLARDASFFLLGAVTLMIGFSFEPPLAFKIGATIALIFTVILLIRSYLLTEERFRRSEVWRGLEPDERPDGEHGVRIARDYMQELLLRFAKSSSAIAGVLYGSALVLSLTATNTDTNGFVTAGVASLH
jgi:hypothetical protein